MVTGSYRTVRKGEVNKFLKVERELVSTFDTSVLLHQGRVGGYSWIGGRRLEDCTWSHQRTSKEESVILTVGDRLHKINEEEHRT